MPGLIIIVVVVWIVVGGISQNNNSPPAEPPFDNCAVCRKVWAWWDALDFWGRVAGAAWYTLQSIGCAINGCRRP